MNKREKGKEWKESVTKKAPKQNTDKDVIFYIGIAEWDPKTETLRKKHGKRLALRVNTLDPPAELLQKALNKWKAYHSNCYMCCYLKTFRRQCISPVQTKRSLQLGGIKKKLERTLKTAAAVSSGLSPWLSP